MKLIIGYKTFFERKMNDNLKLNIMKTIASKTGTRIFSFMHIHIFPYKNNNEM